MQFMLDTNICIYIIKKKPRKVFDTLKKLKIGVVCISAITLAELEYGAEKSQHRERNKIALAGFLTPLEILPFSDKSAVKFGEIRATLEKKGQVIGAYDLLIGAHALSENLTLVTNNTKEFSRIPNISLENWVE
ncbi:tRNA(fMet)-specific endonuclease VapC [Desulfotomaculum arcticum]|uniref:Ribonuclease VapC n=1 Tax=Desulfotruncus arcticus DSM 17038 TaxID=1121424 RepID=A0A1I2R3D9_9FIRM|nr:type II toxin-antitoxin system VapC family toxin [Desulfotruncus arcticus]SFG34910.1 tRNA(fMet)-specific endonuclease VapC [Desulfotomaculum arcticum] [Desulfotruncus arcticus DSM 17038]